MEFLECNKCVWGRASCKTIGGVGNFLPGLLDVRHPCLTQILDLCRDHPIAGCVAASYLVTPPPPTVPLFLVGGVGVGFVWGGGGEL